MVANVKVVTAYCNLGLSKRPAKDFHELGERLVAACGEDAVVYKYAPEDAWTWVFRGYPAANARATDRFADAAEHERSNLIQHTPVQWLERAAVEFPDVGIFVWLGYSLLKQGGHTGKPIEPTHVKAFIDRVKHWKGGSLPFPGMDPYINPVEPFGDNWRFCGSTLVVPREFILRVGASYRANLQAFIVQHKSIPLDLAIWPMVEFSSGLPWRFYQAEYDHTQLTNFHC